MAAALGASLVPADGIEGGDVPLEWEGAVVGGFRLPGLRGALDRLLAQVRRDVRVPLAELSREQKQEVVAHLDDQGAFQLRRAVDDVADALGVSRFTVYNYLNARDSPG